MGLLFFRNQEHAHGSLANTNFCHWASPCSPSRRGRYQRGNAPLWCEQTECLSLARATQWPQKTLRLLALTPQFLQQLIEGDERYPRVHKQVAPDESPGWTVVLLERATRCMWDRQWGRQDRKVLQKAMRLGGHVIEQTGALTLWTEGERR